MEINDYDLIVIGSGPSGIFCAINVAKENKKVLLLEKNNILGKKLLVAGHGKCNLTNNMELKNFIFKYGEKGKFLKTSLYLFTPENLKKWFLERGLPLVADEGSGKYFPKTMNSRDVVNLLEKECLKNSVEIKKMCPAEKIEKIESLDNKVKFKVKTSQGDYFSKNLVIATGGKSYPATGTTGDGYIFAKQLEHSVTEITPSLSPIYVDNYNFDSLSGISFKNIGIKLYRENKLIAQNRGDILLTHHNLSGPGIIDFSRNVRKNDVLKINFLDCSKEILEKNILELISTNGKINIKKFLLKFNLPERFCLRILSLLNIKDDKKISEISKQERSKIVQLCEYPFVVTRVGGYEIAMATSGGVDLNQINSKTLESKIIKNLFFIGEILDIDGDTGGFNIQAAFSMGFLAAKTIILKL